MQTFLPYKSFVKSLNCLDNKRLGKQRVEAMQILNAITQGPEALFKTVPKVANNGDVRFIRKILWHQEIPETLPIGHYIMPTPWYNHPTVKMWKDHANELAFYHDCAIFIWVSRGFKNTMKLRWYTEDTQGRSSEETIKLFTESDNSIEHLEMAIESVAISQYPKWLTDDFCSRHRSNLLRKGLLDCLDKVISKHSKLKFRQFLTNFKMSKDKSNLTLAEIERLKNYCHINQLAYTNHYDQFNWQEPINLEYIYPV